MGQFWIVCPVADSNHEILDKLWINRLLAIRSVRWGMPRWDRPADSIDILICADGSCAAHFGATAWPRNMAAGSAPADFSLDGANAGSDQRPVSILAFICK